MPIKYKTVEKPLPGKSEKKWYASANTSGEKTLEGLTTDIEKISTVSGADIRAVLYALVDVMTTSLADGQIIRLGELGSMRVNISSEGKDKAEEVTVATIKGAKIIFTPSTKIKTMLNNLKYEKM